MDLRENKELYGFPSVRDEKQWALTLQLENRQKRWIKCVFLYTRKGTPVLAGGTARTRA